MVKISFLLILLLMSVYSFSQTNKDILGVWINEDDLNLVGADRAWTMEFRENGILVWTTSGTKIDSLTYKIGDPFCSSESVMNHLSITFPDEKEIFCYYIHGISQLKGRTYLSIEYLENPRPFVFIKKE